MKYEFGVTIGSRLDDQDIRDTQTFKHVHVLDLRRCINNGPFPIEERTLRKLANFQVTYEQMPMSLYSASSRAENELFNTITNTKGNVLILTDEMVPLARFCQQLDIPFSSRDLYIVETAGDYVPVQVAKKPRVATRFGSLAS